MIRPNTSPVADRCNHQLLSCTAARVCSGVNRHSSATAGENIPLSAQSNPSRNNPTATLKKMRRPKFQSVTRTMPPPANAALRVTNRTSDSFTNVSCC
jgi:hypothetical protein